MLERVDKNLSISHSKIKLDRCVFNVSRTKTLLDHIAKYRKKWHEPTGRYLDDPLHDIHSNYADAFRYVCMAISHIETVSSMSGALERHKTITESRNRRIF